MPPPFPRPHMMDPSFLIAEFVYAAIIISICIIIYAKTRELYHLSRHEGIRHFREAFLFFALAYLFRLIPVLFRLADLRLPGYRIGFTAGFFLFSYASTMAITSIARSVTWKKTSGLLKQDITYHLLAILIAVLVLSTGSTIVFFISQATLIIGAFILTKAFHQRTRKRATTYHTYLLLLLFWMMNIAIISTHQSLRGIKEPLYILSAGLFIIILYKVLGRTRR